METTDLDRNSFAEFPEVDDRQTTHLICVRLEHLLYDFLRGCFGPLFKKNNRKEAQNTPLKSHIANVLGGHRLDE